MKLKIAKTYLKLLLAVYIIIMVLSAMTGLYVMTMPNICEQGIYLFNGKYLLFIILFFAISQWVVQWYIDKHKPKEIKGERFIKDYVVCPNCGNDRFELPKNYHDKYKNKFNEVADEVKQNIFRYECTKCGTIIKQKLENDYK